MLWFLAAVFLCLAVPVVIAWCAGGDPGNAARHENGEPDETRVKHR